MNCNCLVPWQVPLDGFKALHGSDGIKKFNIHKAGATSSSVDKWSAGCQVFARERDFTQFLNLLKQAGQQRFMYTLLHADQVK